MDECGSFGGCRLTITGRGFNTDCSKVDINFGPASCIVSSCTATSVECTLEYAAAVHRVTNNGLHPKYGEQFAWDPRVIEIMAGDMVYWIWSPPQFIRSLKYKVAETDTETDTEPKSGGFESSDIGTMSGSYKIHFPNIGTHHYFSGYVDELETILFRGKVKVVPRQSFVSYLTLKQGSTEATYTPSCMYTVLI